MKVVHIVTTYLKRVNIIVSTEEIMYSIIIVQLLNDAVQNIGLYTSELIVMIMGSEYVRTGTGRNHCINLLS
jgi:hypothetical protein